MSAMDAAFSDVTRCTRFTDDISVHWYPEGSVAGDLCYCGELRMAAGDPE